MKPIATRLLLVFVSMVVLLSCAATVSRMAAPGHEAPLPSDKVLLTRRSVSEPVGSLDVEDWAFRGAAPRHRGASECRRLDPV